MSKLFILTFSLIPKSLFRFVPYEFVAGLFPPNPSYEQTSIFLLSCSVGAL